MDKGKACRSNLLDSVLDDLRFQIINREIFAGTFLAEETLSEEYGISRGSIRTVLSFLEQEGLIEILPNGRRRVHGFSEEDALTCWELRTYLECTAVKRILASHASYIGKVSELISKIGTDIPTDRKLDAATSIAVDMEIHRALMASVDNKLLLNTWNNLSHVLEALMKINAKDWYQEEYVSTLRESHMPLFLALLQGDPAAADLMVSHIDRAKEISIAAFHSMK